MTGLVLVRRLVVCALLLLSSDVYAQQIIVGGDLTGTSNGVLFSPPGSNNTQPFSFTGGGNSIAGDVYVANNLTGDAFTLTITNLTFTSVNPNPSGVLDVFVEVVHDYLPGSPGPFFGNHVASGSWSGGPLTVLQLDTLLDVGGTNVYLPQIVVDLPSQNPAFTAGPNPGVVPTTPSNPFRINSILRLRIDGPGVINLPNSADVFVTVPEPTALAVLTLTALILFRGGRSYRGITSRAGKHTQA